MHYKHRQKPIAIDSNISRGKQYKYEQLINYSSNKFITVTQSNYVSLILIHWRLNFHSVCYYPI